ncbi:MAG: DUF1549 domain-containing protein, partial [Acidobacteria bacterium]|nr:DUF1549 domain-containing protein [Acidobacteriota bacterium]
MSNQPVPAVWLVVCAAAVCPAASVRFSPDVISILTIKGCNGSGCHGSPAGQNGFKLSLFGSDVEADYRAITPRVNLDKPEQSLLLAKPSFAAPHGGGRVLAPDSEEYQVLLDWLRQGAPLSGGGPRLARLEIEPGEKALRAGGATLQLRVAGILSDGSASDMTRQVRYLAADDAVARVTGQGVVTPVSRGLTTVMARAMGQVATAQIAVVTAAPDPSAPPANGNNFIDELVFAKLREMSIAPWPLTTDREFVRRVYLDAIGVLPSPDEARAFLDDPRPGKRARLIDALLERPEYASHWTVKFEDWLRNCQLHMQGRSMGVFKDWIHEWVAADRPYQEVVRELLTSMGDTMLNPAANFWHPATDFMLKKFEVNKVTPTVSRLFLGVRLECAECHNHPLENFTQDDFLGLSAFFARLRVKHGYGEYRRTWYLDSGGELMHPVSKQPVKAKFLGAETPAIPDGVDRRAALAEWITSPANPYFSRATVNRIWNEYFQTGIVEPFDDFRSTNMPTNRALLDRLARHFVESGFKLKALHRAILNSRVYQLSSRDASREPGTLERLLFARYEPRKLTAEVLLDAIGQVTGVAHGFRGYPAGTSAKDLYVPDGPDYFLVTFGLPRRDILAGRPKSPT